MSKKIYAEEQYGSSAFNWKESLMRKV